MAGLEVLAVAGVAGIHVGEFVAGAPAATVSAAVVVRSVMELFAFVRGGWAVPAGAGEGVVTMAWPDGT